MTENNAAQPGLTEPAILHRWDTHVGQPDAARPLTDADKIAFARAIESALLSKLRAEGVQAGAGWQPIDTAPAGIRILLGPRDCPVVGVVRITWNPDSMENERSADVVHYNGTRLVAGYRCTEWAPLHAAPMPAMMADVTPPATARERWYYDQGRLAEREASAPVADEQPIKLSDDVLHFLKEGVENATQCEEADVDQEFADQLLLLMHTPLYTEPRPKQREVDWGPLVVAPVAGKAQPVAWANEDGDPISDAMKQARPDLYGKNYTRPLYAAPQASEAVRAPDYTLQHADHMAVSAEQLMEAINARDALIMQREESDDVDDDTLWDQHETVSEYLRGMREAIYEYRKRRNRAALSAQPGAQKYWLCCGSKDPNHPNRRAPDCFNATRAKWGTADQHSAAQKPHPKQHNDGGAE